MAHAHYARIPWCFTYVTHSEEGKEREEGRVKRDEGRLAVALAGLAAGVVRLGNCRDSKYFSFRPLTATQ